MPTVVYKYHDDSYIQCDRKERRAPANVI